MIQLSLVGPPQEPAQLSARGRLRRRVYAAISAALAVYAIECDAVDHATEAVVDELTSPESGDRAGETLGGDTRDA